MDDPNGGPVVRLKIFAAVAVMFLAGPTDGRDVITFEGFGTGDARFFTLSIPEIPSTVCAPPAALVEPASPIVLGNGTPGSVTRAQIQTALDGGGEIVFDLGPAPATIVLDQELVVTREVLLDGGDLVTLSGGGQTRVLRVEPPWNPSDRYTFTLQRMRVVNGRTPPGASDLPGSRNRPVGHRTSY